MTAWTSDELEAIAAADELELTLGARTVTIWVVRVGDHLYIRSWRGASGSWFRDALQTHEGQISAGGVEKNVSFVEADDEANDAVDDAYRSKYGRYAASYVEPMVRAEARATTTKLVPRAEETP
jgi:hypothetical protein